MVGVGGAEEVSFPFIALSPEVTVRGREGLTD